MSADGTSWNPADLAINGHALYKKVNAFIYDGEARAIEQDGTLVATMQGPFHIDIATNGATWTNGTDTWVITDAGCGCGS